MLLLRGGPNKEFQVSGVEKVIPEADRSSATRAEVIFGAIR